MIRSLENVTCKKRELGRFHLEKRMRVDRMVCMSKGELIKIKQNLKKKKKKYY